MKTEPFKSFPLIRELRLAKMKLLIYVRCKIASREIGREMDLL